MVLKILNFNFSIKSFLLQDLTTTIDEVLLASTEKKADKKFI